MAPRDWSRSITPELPEWMPWGLARHSGRSLGLLPRPLGERFWATGHDVGTSYPAMVYALAMPGTATEKLVRALLESDLSLEVARIPTARTEQADFAATDLAGQNYIVEAKGKGNDGAFEAKLRKEGIASLRESEGRRDTVSRILRKAGSQADSTAVEGNVFRVLCFVAEGSHPESQLEQLQATLYGTVPLVDLAELEANPGAARDRRCYFLRTAEFFVRPRLEAVVGVWPGRGCRLFANRLSPRSAEFEQSLLYAAFRDRGLLTSPWLEEERGTAFLADCFDISPKEQGRRLAYVQAKYNRPFLTPMKPSSLVTGLLVPAK